MFFRRSDDKKLKGLILMIDKIYNSRIGTIKTYHFSVEWEQTIIFHKLYDLQSETAADESCIQKGFKDGVYLMKKFGMSV